MNTLAVEDDVSDWVSNAESVTRNYAVMFSPSADFDGVVTFRSQNVSEGADDAASDVDVALPYPLAQALLIPIPPGWRFRFVLSTATAGDVCVDVAARGAGFDNIGPEAYLRVSAYSARVTDAQTAFDAIAAVVTDLGSDVAGSSVAQAITDLEDVETDLTTNFGVS